MFVVTTQSNAFVFGVLGLSFVLLMQPADAHSRVRWAAPGDYRLQLVLAEPFALDEASRSNEQQVLRHRLRLQPTVEVGRVSVFLELNVLTGQIFGTTTERGAQFADRREVQPDERYDGWTNVEPRQAWFQARVPWAVLKMGQFADHWGLGLVHNGGSQRTGENWTLRPGSDWHGDLVARAELALQPFTSPRGETERALTLRMGGGVVYQDDQANIFDGEEAVQYTAAVSWDTALLQLGARYTRREQSGDSSGELETDTTDAYVKWNVPLFLLNAELGIHAEVAHIDGRHLGPSAETGSLRTQMKATGAVAELKYRSFCPKLAYSIRGGALSGGGSARAGFVADPDFEMGFILFPEVIRLTSARQADLTRDDERSDGVYRSANWIPTKGSGTNVRYLAPNVSWRPGALEFGLQALLAWTERASTVAAARPQASFTLDGYYGTEFVGMARWRGQPLDLFEVGVGLDAGVLLPGPALDRALRGNPVSKFMSTVSLGW